MPARISVRDPDRRGSRVEELAIARPGDSRWQIGSTHSPRFGESRRGSSTGSRSGASASPACPARRINPHAPLVYAEPARPSDLAPILLESYGLTQREVEIVLLLARAWPARTSPQSSASPVTPCATASRPPSTRLASEAAANSLPVSSLSTFSPGSSVRHATSPELRLPNLALPCRRHALPCRGSA